MRSNGEVRFVRISTALQLKIAAALCGLLLLWLAMTGAALVQRILVEQERAALGERAAVVAKSAGRVAAFRSSVDDIAGRLEQRQHQLDRIVGRYFGKIESAPAVKPIAMKGPLPETQRLAAIERDQIAFAEALTDAAIERSEKAEAALRHYGINPRTVARPLPEGMGGPFGVRADPFTGGAAMHTGLDIKGERGQPIYAAAPGRVVKVGPWSGYGNVVVIDHGHGFETRYGHLSGFTIREGAVVKAGQQIALMGSTGRSTGNHLHFEVRINGRAVNPRPYLEASSDVLEIKQGAGRRFAVGSQRS